mmetsp:Transcript_24655/g.76046  ORF Transcript_24655/g.76046 Transcript_24655/m.76046 type:complete len:216 (+) Transcript_24655:508-1155(+)
MRLRGARPRRFLRTRFQGGRRRVVAPDQRGGGERDRHALGQGRRAFQRAQCRRAPHAVDSHVPLRPRRPDPTLRPKHAGVRTRSRRASSIRRAGRILRDEGRPPLSVPVHLIPRRTDWRGTRCSCPWQALLVPGQHLGKRHVSTRRAPPRRHEAVSGIRAGGGVARHVPVFHLVQRVASVECRPGAAVPRQSALLADRQAQAAAVLGRAHALRPW